MRGRVVVTGIGWVPPLGAEIEPVWKRLLAGESGVGYITLFDASSFPTKISAEVRGWGISGAGEIPGPPPALRRRRRQEGRGRLGSQSRARRPDPVRRLHRQRRRPAGFRL